MRGKIVLIEGTDCSGKATQTELLLQAINKMGVKAIKMSFPDYESPTGKIVGGPYLGKPAICEGWFKEGADNVSPKVSALYYAADFLYHLEEMNKILDSGTWILLDRYFYSTFAHQGGKELDKEKRMAFYKWLEKLEFDLIGLPDPEIKIFLHMPYECSIKLREEREEVPDQNERSSEHLKHAEQAYLELAKLYNFYTITCNDGDKIKSVEEISKDVTKYVKSIIEEF